MNWTEDQIEELLNSFIDGELTQRQQTEVQRLIAHDEQVAQRLRELQKCKVLVGSLPSVEAPVEVAEEIKASLGGAALLGYQPQPVDRRVGARHLLVRRLTAVAAMVGLVAVLAVLVYTIVAPEYVPDRSVAVEAWEQPVGQVEVEGPRPSMVASAEKPTSQAGIAKLGFNGRLELKTDALIAVSASINKAIEDNGLLEKVSAKAEENKSVYVISCSREALNLLLADLETIWDRFDLATLFVETEVFGEQVMVETITAEQIAEIVNQGSFERRIEVAKDFAVLNKTAELLPGREILVAINNRKLDLITIPKPVLTSSEKAIKRPASQVKDEQDVHLTIVVAER